MPLTSEGKKVLQNMKKQYGAEKGKEVFYASINKGKPGSDQWHLEHAKKAKIHRVKD